MSFADYWENKILDHIFGKGAYTPPTIYVGLSTANPGEAGAGLAEPSGNGYARVTTAAGDWNAASDGEIDNANDLEFPESTGAWASGSPLTYFALFDAATDGNLLAYGPLSQSRTVDAAGITLSFAAGDLGVTLD